MVEDNLDDLPIIRGVLARYFAEGLLPQSPLLQSILKNDLRRVILRYDGERRISVLRDVLIYLSDRAPAECWGSAEAVANWVYAGGEEGRRRQLKDYEDTTAGMRRRP